MAASLISLLWFLTPDTSPDLVKLPDIILEIDGLGLFPKVSTFFFFFLIRKSLSPTIEHKC